MQGKNGIGAIALTSTLSNRSTSAICVDQLIQTLLSNTPPAANNISAIPRSVISAQHLLVLVQIDEVCIPKTLSGEGEMRFCQGYAVCPTEKQKNKTRKALAHYSVSWRN